MATAVAGILIAMLVHPLQAIGVVVGFGLIGIVLGHSFRANYSPAKTMVWGSLASLLSKAAVLGIGALVMGVNPFDVQSDAMGQAISQALEVYRSFGMKEEDLAQMAQNMQALIDLMKIILPAGFAMAAVVDTYLNFMIAKAVLKKLGHSIAGFPPFKQWNLPYQIVYLFACALLLLYWGQSREILLMKQVGMNLQVMTSMLLLIQGLALFYYLADKYNLSRFTRGIILFLIFTNGLFTQVLIFAGAFDMAVDYRKLRLDKPRLF
jgi:uncharacterized protein YybS (DUF2232 family)